MSWESPSDSHSPGFSKPKVLITGIEGFTGTYLKQHLERIGYVVHGVTLSDAAGDRLYHVDLLDIASLKHVVEHVRPDYVFHLAAISSVAHDDVAKIYTVNVLGTRNLLAVLATMPGGGPRRIVLASSGNIYGNNAAELLSEDTILEPMSDYAVSKVAMEMMAQLWADRMPITLVRPFNYTGRGQSENFLVPKIVAAFRRRAGDIELGNMHVERDFSDVRDVVACYQWLISGGVTGRINICSGRSISLSSVLGLCEEITGHHLVVRVNPSLVRGNEVHRLRGSRHRLDSLGVPEFRPFRETLAWMLEEGA